MDIPKDLVIACGNYGVSEEAYIRYAKSLKDHINCVIEAFIEKLGGNYGEVEYHDLSKWKPCEFPFYAKHFQGGGDPNGFSRAWLHHLHNNPHHWQYWMFPDNFSPKGSNVINGCLPMPHDFCMEMVADWMGASKAYTGDWNMSKWLKDNFHKVKLHPDSLYGTKATLLELGYNVDKL
jgi:hypothetical protein